MLCKTLVSLDVRDVKGQTALHLAARRGFSKCVEVLLQHQASYSLRELRHKWTALHAAGGHSFIITLLHVYDVYCFLFNSIERILVNVCISSSFNYFFLLNQLRRGKWTVCFCWSTRNKVQTSLTVRTRRDSEWNLVCFLQTCHVKRLQSFFLMKKWNPCTFFPIGVLFFCASKSILLYFLHLLVVLFLVRKSQI